MANESAIAGPELVAATVPVRTKMPAPMMTPTPKTMRSSVAEVLLQPGARARRSRRSTARRTWCGTRSCPANLVRPASGLRRPRLAAGQSGRLEGLGDQLSRPLRELVGGDAVVALEQPGHRHGRRNASPRAPRSSRSYGARASWVVSSHRIANQAIAVRGAGVRARGTSSSAGMSVTRRRPRRPRTAEVSDLVGRVAAPRGPLGDALDDPGRHPVGRAARSRRGRTRGGSG